MKEPKKGRRSEPAERKPGFPEGDDDVINKYGTYEVQRTCGMENPYPMIAQGLATELSREQMEDAEAWKERH